jgi:hypothetical protein
MSQFRDEFLEERECVSIPCMLEVPKCNQPCPILNPRDYLFSGLSGLGYRILRNFHCNLHKSASREQILGKGLPSLTTSLLSYKFPYKLVPWSNIFCLPNWFDALFNSKSHGKDLEIRTLCNEAVRKTIQVLTWLGTGTAPVACVGGGGPEI